MSKYRKMKKDLEYRDNAKEKYDKFFNFKITCSICGAETNLQWFNHHLKNKKCLKMQNLIYKKDELDDKIQILKDKIYFIKYGSDNLNINENSNINKDELTAMLGIKNELK
jgi:hypothetical protein